MEGNDRYAINVETVVGRSDPHTSGHSVCGPSLPRFPVSNGVVKVTGADRSAGLHLLVNISARPFNVPTEYCTPI